MKNFKRLILLTTFCSIVLALPSFIGVSWAQNETVLIIVNKENTNKDITATTIKNGYLGYSKFWGDGERMVPINLADNDEAKVAFFKKILNMTPRRYKFHWRKNELAGKGIEPKALSSSAKVLDAVLNSKGAVGYVLQSQLSEEQKNSVRIAQTIETE